MPRELGMRDGEDTDDEENVPHEQTTFETEEELDKKYPNRPHNHSQTLPFRDLFLTLFNPLNENKKRPSGPVQARRRQQSTQNVQETRKSIIQRFITRWRKEVGKDIYPAFRLIVPEKDRERAMYGLKEKTIAKLLLKVVQVDKASDAGYGLLNWKLPGIKSTSQMAGDFAGRCHEVLSDRASRTEPGDLTIEEVNDMLDRLSRTTKEEDQVPIFREFYNNMNAEEMMWLIRIILRQMKVGATEKTLFGEWHPNAEDLFNVSSSLRRVCWELHDTELRLDSQETGITLMQCFQPQLAQFQMRSIDKMIARMHATGEDPYFWIEEKLDGERMQLHMIEDEEEPGSRRFGFWSRKAKDYTYLYGKNYYDRETSLTSHLKGAFHSSVRNIVLDGEMITWDPISNKDVAFGHLKTAALNGSTNHSATRPVFRVFDCLYMNDRDLTGYTLQDRRNVLTSSVKDVKRRLEVHPFVEATTAAEVEPLLRNVIAEAGEGLVLKNPRSVYQLNHRNDDWMKVKPEYMTEFGESLDCIVIGGYYGSGHRGGNLSSFLCGLRMDPSLMTEGQNPEYTLSFFKVGGGFKAEDYAEIRHRTDGKWIEWDSKNPPRDWIQLGGVDDQQLERPDMWIKPHDSVVLSVKAASVIHVNTFAHKKTLRFPRFKALRTDKDWKQALSIVEFNELNFRAEREKAEKEFKIDDARKKRQKKTRKNQLTVIGADEEVKTPYAGPETALFNGMCFYIITGAAKPINKSKADLEQMVKANGGKIVATHTDPSTICIAEGNPIRVASIKKSGTRNIFKPSWLLESVAQAERDIGRSNSLLPYEPRHVLFSKPEDEGSFSTNVDEYGDSFARDIQPDELADILSAMKTQNDDDYDADDIMNQVFDDDILEGPGAMFRGLRVHVVEAGSGTVSEAARRIALFAGTDLADSLDDGDITHVVLDQTGKATSIRGELASHMVQPRIVTTAWVTESLREGTRLDEEQYAPT